jgi:predicted amidohydrolase YtcJ
MEDRIGSLQLGKLADVTIVDGDLQATAPERIGSLGTWITILDGNIAWSAPTAPVGGTQTSS